MQYAFHFDHQRCVKCHACEIACKTWNEVDIGPRWREVVKLESGVFPDVKAMNVSMACMHCGEAPCAKACPVAAISKHPMTGVVTVDANRCIGCGFCTWACPFGAPQVSSVRHKMEKCNFCQTPGMERPLDMPRACEEICPTGAIRSGPLAAVSTAGRERAAARLGSPNGHGFPAVVVDGAERFAA